MRKVDSSSLTAHPKKSMACALLVLAAILLVKFHPLLDSDATRPSHDWNDIHQTDALHLLMAQDEGRFFPFWTPYIQSGAPLYAVPTKPFTYPLFIPAVTLLGPYLGMNVLTLVHVLIGGAGMILLLRRLQCTYLAALVGAIFFTTTTYPGSLFISQPYWGYAVAWWPCAVICVLNMLENRRAMISALLLGGLFALQLHAGGIFPLYWIGCFLSAFSLPYLFGKVKWLRLLGAGALALATFAGLSAMRLIPALLWMKTTGRGAPLSHEEILFGYEVDLLPHDQGHPALTILYTLFVLKKHDLTVMAVCLVLGLLFSLTRRKGLAALAGAAFCLVIVTGLAHTFFYDYLPGYNRMRMPYRFCLPAGMGLILMACFGVDTLWRFACRVRPLAARGAIGLVLVLAVMAGSGALPYLRYFTWDFVSAKERQEMAQPVFKRAAADPRHGRLHYPLSGDQALWIPLGIEATTGLVGGGGSTNRIYGEWIPRDDPAGKSRTDAAAYGNLLDLLNTRYMASFTPLKDPALEEIFQAGSNDPDKMAKATDAFVARVARDGTVLEYCGYIGGYGEDVGYGITVDPSGKAHVTGHTTSTEESFPHGNGADEKHKGDADAFIARIEPEGAGLEWCTFLGGKGLDWGVDIESDDQGHLYITGQTASGPASFPCRGGPRTQFAGSNRDAFVAKLVDRQEGDPGLEPAPKADPTKKSKETQSLYPVPIHIIRNQGQLHEEVKYYLQGWDRAVFFGTRGLTWLNLQGSAPWSLKFDFIGADPQVEVRGNSLLRARYNFFQGRPADWITGVPTCSEVSYPGLWPGIDLIIRTGKDRLKATYIVQPGANPEAIRVACRGADHCQVNRRGALALSSSAGRFEDAPPMAFQMKEGKQQAVPVSYHLHDHDETGAFTYGFSLGPYDETLPLFIDPSVVLFCGYLGGLHDDMGKAVATGKGDSIYVAGQTFSSCVAYPPTAGVLEELPRPDSDAFVARVHSATGDLLYWSVLRGAASDFSQGITVDDAGHAYTTGSTRSKEQSFPVIKGPDLTFNGEEDAFVAKLSPAGDQLIFCGYLGGAVGDYGQGIDVDPSGNIYLSGDTKSDEKSFPVIHGPDLTHNGRADGFVARVKASGESLDFCGYIGGAAMDVAYDLILGAEGHAHVTGVTNSKEDSFPVKVGPALTLQGGWDGFVARVAPLGSSLEYCGYVGGSGTDISYSIALDKEERAHITGTTTSDEESFPVRVGPDLTFARDPYKAYLEKYVGKSSGPKIKRIKPYLRLHVYERSSCLERASLVTHPILVVGEAQARSETIQRLVRRPAFQARQTVFIEKEKPEAGDEALYSSVLLAGLSPNDPEAAAWMRLWTKGRIESTPFMGLMWRRDPLDPKARCRVTPLAHERIRKGMDEMTLDLQGMAGPFLLLSEVMTLHPGWRAEVDGRPAALLRADGIITAVQLPPGAAQVRFRFTPPGFRAGLWITVGTALLLLAAWPISRRVRRRA